MAKILITGANGQLGKKLNDLLSDGNDLILTDSHNMDITNKEEVVSVISKEKPDFIIHAAAYTKVDQAEEDVELCRKINAEGTKNVAESAKDISATFFYISTDYVFDGNKTVPYTEEDRPNPLSVYGQTKLEGEKFVEEICNSYYILRVSWLFGELPEDRGGNFIETMLRLGKEKEELSIVNDQVGSPTYTQDLVEIIRKVIDQKPPYGIYHFSGDNACSWYDFAREVFKLANIEIKLNSITSDQFPQKAKRPNYSYLSKEKIEKALNIKVRDWKHMVSEYLNAKA